MAGGTIQKHSQELQRAVRWVAEQRKQNPEVALSRWLSEAGPRFNLSPMEQEGLFRLLQEGDQG